MHRCLGVLISGSAISASAPEGWPAALASRHAAPHSSGMSRASWPAASAMYIRSAHRTTSKPGSSGSVSACQSSRAADTCTCPRHVDQSSTTESWRASPSHAHRVAAAEASKFRARHGRRLHVQDARCCRGLQRTVQRHGLPVRQQHLRGTCGLPQAPLALGATCVWLCAQSGAKAGHTELARL